MSWEFPRDTINKEDTQFLHNWENRSHRLNCYYRFCAELNPSPKRVLELGVRGGYSGLAIMSACPGAEYVGVDTYPVKEDQQGRRDWLFWARHIFGEAGVRATFIVGDSHRACPMLAEGIFDLVHVDAEHTYEGALSDLKQAQRLVRDGGVVIADDVHAVAVENAVRDSGVCHDRCVVSKVPATGQLSLAFTVKK